MALHNITTEAAARQNGFTQALFASSDFNDIDILVREGTDLDDRYQAYVPDWNEVININGWMWITTPIANAFEEA